MARRAARRSPRVPHDLYTPRRNLVRTLRLSGHATVLFPRLSASSEAPETSCLHTMQIVNFRFHPFPFSAIHISPSGSPLTSTLPLGSKREV